MTDVTAVYPHYEHVVPSWRTHFWQIVVRVETDTGVVGLGYGGGGVAGVDIVNRHFRELLLGWEVNEPADIANVWDHLYAQSLSYGRKEITAVLRIVDLARNAGIPVSPHRGGEVWSLHLMVASDWGDFAEYHSDHIRPERDVLWRDEPAPHEGYISPNDRPGFGFTLNETML